MIGQNIFGLIRVFHTLFLANGFFLLWWDLGNGIRILDLEILMGIVSLSDFELVAQTHARLLESFCFD